MIRGVAEPTVAVPCNRGCGATVRVPLSVARVFPAVTCPVCQRRYEREARLRALNATRRRLCLSEAAALPAPPYDPARYWWNQL